MSSIVHGASLYTLNGAGALLTYSATDGSEQSKIRVISGKAAWATPVVANGHMYLFDPEGQSYVVKLSEVEGEKAEVVHEHVFEDEVFLGSPAVADNALFVRSDKFVWKIASEKE